ncbi:ATP-binding protein, partial [Allorhizocola rhizosphaerae]|uniref:ATP-binding protein n=1 Tax=Allorhizocola rhizosphaerae TaxID=1872709 RepID=UPI0013C2C67D
MVQAAGPVAGDGRPDPSLAGTAAEFVDALRRLRDWAGVGFRRLEKRAAQAGRMLPRSTINAALKRNVLPREDLVAGLVYACGGDQDEVDRWVAARRRIAARTPPPPASSSDPSAAPSTRDVAAVRSVPGPVRCTLPAEHAVFVGRDKELEQIATAVADAAQVGGVIAIHAIDGMPGIGKTTLAVHVAHLLKDRFGDRQLFVDLRAHSAGQKPVQPADALAQLLAADGVDPRFLPDTLDGRAALWRDRMAGKRLLLVLDNAASSQQVAPLLPGSTCSLVVVTARRSLADLPTAVPIGLDVLTPDEAITMFARLAPQASTDREATAELVRACGYLPLAISIAASLYLRHRTWNITDLLYEVRQANSGLLTLTAENRTVAAVFDLSYQHQPADRQRVFRLLGLHPGVEVEPYAAAALAGISPMEAQQHLDALHADHLLEEPVYRRYRMHDLIRAYTQSLTATIDPPESRHEALGRLLDFYRHTAVKAMNVVYPYERQRRSTIAPIDSPTPDLSDQDRAARWLDTELANLLAAARHAAAHDRPEHLLYLSALLHQHVLIRGHYQDGEALHQQALNLARQLGDRLAELEALIVLGQMHWVQDRYQQAADHVERALQIAQTTGNRDGELKALVGLGHTHWVQGRYEQAADHFGRALYIAQTTADQGGELSALVGLGHTHWAQGRYQQAADHFGQALQIARRTGNRDGEMRALTNLGIIRRAQDGHQEAADHLERALHIAQATGNRDGEMRALTNLGQVHRVQGRYQQA